MLIVFAMMAGAFLGVALMGLLLCAKGDDACEYCPYKNYYLDNITEESNNGSGYEKFQSQ